MSTGPKFLRTALLGVAAAVTVTVLAGGTVVGAPAATARPKPLPPLDIEIVRITTHDIRVRVVCPVDPPEYVYVFTTGATSGVPRQGLGSLRGFTCLRTRAQRLVLPLDPGVRLHHKQYLGEVGITLSGDSGEMNNVHEKVVVGTRVARGTLF